MFCAWVLLNWDLKQFESLNYISEDISSFKQITKGSRKKVLGRNVFGCLNRWKSYVPSRQQDTLDAFPFLGHMLAQQSAHIILRSDEISNKTAFSVLLVLATFSEGKLPFNFFQSGSLFDYSLLSELARDYAGTFPACPQLPVDSQLHGSFLMAFTYTETDTVLALKAFPPLFLPGMKSSTFKEASWVNDPWR